MGIDSAPVKIIRKDKRNHLSLKNQEKGCVNFLILTAEMLDDFLDKKFISHWVQQPRRNRRTIEKCFNPK